MIEYTKQFNYTAEQHQKDIHRIESLAKAKSNYKTAVFEAKHPIPTKKQVAKQVESLIKLEKSKNLKLAKLQNKRFKSAINHEGYVPTMKDWSHFGNNTLDVVNSKAKVTGAAIGAAVGAPIVVVPGSSIALAAVGSKLGEKSGKKVGMRLVDRAVKKYYKTGKI